MRSRAEPKKAASSGKPRGINSIEIGFRVIDALRSGGGPQSLKELAAASRLPASNCHRYLVSFVRTGYVAQDAVTGKYDLGPQCLKAGLAALSRLDAIAVGSETLSRLVDATGYTGQLAIWADPGVVIIRWLPGRLAVRTTLGLGSTLPLLSSATGRVFLAFLPERRTAKQAEIERANPHGQSPISVAAAHKMAADVRAVGYAGVSGETIPGLSAVCAPLLDSTGEAAATMTLIGLSDGIAPGALKALRKASSDASHNLGWSGTFPAI